MKEDRCPAGKVVCRSGILVLNSEHLSLGLDQCLGTSEAERFAWTDADLRFVLLRFSPCKAQPGWRLHPVGAGVASKCGTAGSLRPDAAVVLSCWPALAMLPLCPCARLLIA